MPLDIKRTWQGVIANAPATTDTPLLTPNGPTKLLVKSIVIFNQSAGAIVVVVNVRQTTNGVVDAAGPTNQIVNETIAAKTRLVLSGDPLLTLVAGAIISINPAAVGINAWASADVADRDH